MFKNILLIQLRQLGDILLTTPCIRELRQAFPQAQVSFLSHPMGKLVLEDNPWLHQAFYYDPQSLFQELLLLRRLRSENFDLIIDFMNNPRSGFYTLFAGRNQRWAFSSRRSFAYTKTRPRQGGTEYIVREKLRLLELASLTPHSTQLDLPWNESHLKPVSLLPEHPLRIALSPTHRRTLRQWPQQNYAALAERMVHEWDAQVLWIWGPGEEDFVRTCQSLTNCTTYLAPKTSFREMAALVANCDLFVGNSNGPSHVAVAVDTPSLQIHGPTSPLSWCPGTNRHSAISPSVLNSPPHPPIAAGSNQDITTISTNDVWQRLLAIQDLIRDNAKIRCREGLRSHWRQKSPSKL